MCSGWRMPGTPAAATTMPARRVYSGQSGTPVCTTVTAALAVGRFCESSSASGRPSVVPRPRMHDLVPGDRDLVEREQRLDARGRARHRPRHHQREPAHVHRVHAVDVLVGIHLEQRGVEVDLRRRGVLDQERVDGGSSLNARTAASTSACVASSGRCMCGADHPSSARLLHLHADVARARAVVADEDRAEPGRVPVRDAASRLRGIRSANTASATGPPGIIFAAHLRRLLNAGSAVRR